jgi:hypothetical protein
MHSQHYAKLVHERQHIAEVEVELLETDSGWSQYRLPSSINLRSFCSWANRNELLRTTGRKPLETRQDRYDSWDRSSCDKRNGSHLEC